ncbi:hypothetical protein BDQ17DRAFT_572894 [Cyathus striatus]|nr:hypothetical protein BDQ17DRAFT_572894 [Cyathus striatus]
MQTDTKVPRGIKRRRDDDEAIPSDRPTKRRRTCSVVLSEGPSAQDRSSPVPSTSVVTADIEQQVSTTRHFCVSPSSPPRPSSVRMPEPRFPSKGQKRCRDDEECTLSSDPQATQRKTKRRRSDVSSSVDLTLKSSKLVSDTSRRRVQDIGSQKPKKKRSREQGECYFLCS